MYHGICFVSKNDRLSVTGKWYSGKRLGIQGNVVVADRVENLSLASFLAKNNFTEAVRLSQEEK